MPLIFCQFRWCKDMFGTLFEVYSRSLHSSLKCNTDKTKLRQLFAKVIGKSPRTLSNAQEAFTFLKDGANVFLQGGAATPSILLSELYNYVLSKKLKNISVYHINIDGPFPITKPEAAGHFRSAALFISDDVREAVRTGRADYIPIFLSDMPRLFRSKRVKLDLALMSITPPDAFGFCSLGPSVDITRVAAECAQHLVGQINPNLPVTYGEAHIHISHFNSVIHVDVPCHCLKTRPISQAEEKIGALIAENLVDDDSTLQTGIGAIPDSVLSKLTNHKDLGVHTEMFSDGVVKLVECGAVTNAKKNIRRGKIVTSFVIGSEKLFKFINANPSIDFCDSTWVNVPSIIAQNPKPVAINSCIEVDITGQIVSDSIGKNFYSGFGGQIDFIRGASIAEDGLGKPIIALTSTTNKGASKISPFIKQGAGVVTTRAHVHYVVTEYGIADLFGRNVRQRAHALIQIAHPNHR
nr:unnamed protein product [Trichobilharzia regenti]